MGGVCAVNVSFPPTLLSLLTQPVPDALDCMDQCVAGGTRSTECCEERHGTHCALYHRPSGNRGGGSWLRRWLWGGCHASGSRAPAVACHTEHRDPFSFSFPVVLSIHLPLSLSPSFFPLSLALCMPFRAF